MSAVSPGSRLAGKQASEIQYHTLGDDTTSAALTTLHTLIRTSFGPNGQLKLLHNNTGGHVTLTSCSGRLLGALSVSQPVVRLVTTAIQAHVNTYSEGGLFTALLALNLIQNALRLSLPRRLVMEAYELFLRQSLDYLDSADCECRQSLEMGHLDQLRVVVKSVISPKVGCDLSPEDTNHLTGLIIRAFLKTFQGGSASQNPTEGTINYVSLEGRPASESKLHDGVLFATPQIPTYRARQPLIPHLPDGSIRVAVFTVSLAGDSEDIVDTPYELITDYPTGGPDLQAAVLSALEDQVEGLIGAGVGLVCCQRVVHPTVKQKLRAKGILVLDRLGSPHVRPVLTLTGATPLSSFLTCPPEGAYGILDTVRHVVLGGRSYLHLERGGSAVCTLVLCQRTENALDELKHVSSVCQAVLQRALHLPTVLAGGGCWQVHLAGVLRTLMDCRKEELCQSLSCTRSQLAEVGHAFCLSLDQVAMALSTSEEHVTDSTNQHHWTISRGAQAGEDWSKRDIRCSCGKHRSTSDNPKQFYFLGKDSAGSSTWDSEVSSCSPSQSFEIMDLFEVSINGLKTAVAVANMVLGIKHYIHDTN